MLSGEPEAKVYLLKRGYDLKLCDMKITKRIKKKKKKKGQNITKIKVV